jgi:tetratricopeptide (TPR) repeat protein
MEISEVKKIHKNACSLLFSNKVLDALAEIEKLIHASGKEYYIDQIEQHRFTYQNILKHSFSKIKDPEREKVYFYLIRNLLEMADELKENILTHASVGHIYALKKQLENEKKSERKQAIAYLESLTFDTELSGILKQVNIGEDQTSISREDALIRIFNIIWLSDKYNDTEIKLLHSVCESQSLPWYDKSLIVSALTLSLLRYFDISKFHLLFRFLELREQFVWQRAMMGLFIGFLKYNERFYLYPVLKEETSKLKDFENIGKNIEAILIQFTKTRETESVTKKWEQDILPRMMKLRPTLEQKLDLDNIFKNEFGEEKNPDWETVFEDAPDLLDKLQEFTELQMEGMDVFMSAFSQLKNFPFFQKISNWFVPFYHENKAIEPYLSSPGESIDLTPLVQKLESTYFMCNSDKYSFCINLGMIPEQQKTMMMNMVSAEIESVSEIQKGEDLINDFSVVKSIYTQYFQDLYRFFKLHPWRKEFDDIFDIEIDLFQTQFVEAIVSDTKIIRNIAEFYFDKKFYPYALKIFLSLLERDRSNVELFEKIAFCYESQGDFENALDYYQRADIIESQRLWIVKKLALNSKYLNQWDQALEYYKQAEMLNPDDLKIQANIGQCLIHTQNYEQALQYYFKIEVLAPENHKIRRPLAWCSFLLGKFDTAQDYLQRLLAVEPYNPHDLMNLAHVNWCLNNEEKALEYYVQSIKAEKEYKNFEMAFNEDRKHLIRHNISSFDLDLMLEFVKMKAASS